MQIHKIEKY